jgi:LacI family transcriptional regulator
MSGAETVDAGMRKRVMDAARELGYRPNSLARQLRGAARRAVGLVVPTDLTHPFYLALAAHLRDAALREGYEVVIGSSASYSESGYVSAATDLEDRRVAGMLLCGHSSDIKAYLAVRTRAAPPAVVVAGLPTDGMPTVTIDEETAGYQLTRYLIDLDHKVIAHVGLPADVTRTGGRESGYGRAMADAGLEPMRRGPLMTTETARLGVQSLLRDHPAITAIVAFSDTVSIGVVRGLVDAGARVPEDVSVAGFDNIPLGAHLVPALTTVDFQVAEMAGKAVHMLAETMRNGSASALGQQVRLAPQLIVRESTGPNRRGDRQPAVTEPDWSRNNSRGTLDGKPTGAVP